MAPILTKLLAKLKVIRHIKRDVIYGPVHLQGIGFKDIYTLLRETHLALLTQFYKTDNDLRRLMETSVDCLSMDLGLPQ